MSISAIISSSVKKDFDIEYQPTYVLCSLLDPKVYVSNTLGNFQETSMPEFYSENYASIVNFQGEILYTSKNFLFLSKRYGEKIFKISADKKTQLVNRKDNGLALQGISGGGKYISTYSESPHNTAEIFSSEDSQRWVSVAQILPSIKTNISKIDGPSVVYNEGLWVVVFQESSPGNPNTGEGSTVALSSYYSYNGIEWIKGSVDFPESGGPILSIAYANGKYLVITDSWLNPTNYSFTSIDGINWQRVVDPIGGKARGLVSINNTFYLSSSQGSLLYKSIDGVTWTIISSPNSGDFGYINGLYNLNSNLVFSRIQIYYNSNTNIFTHINDVYASTDNATSFNLIYSKNGNGNHIYSAGFLNIEKRIY
jgi:hypothetical protein